MVWTPETSKGYEVRKIRNRIAGYLHGTVLDFGCGDEKVFDGAIGIDLYGKAANLRLDLSNPENVRLFGDEVADVVFSSHFLEDIYDYKGMLRQFWRVLKQNGYLILYLPHKDLYPNIGQPGANPNHKHDFLPEDIVSALDEFANYDLIRCETHSEADEYSFEIIAQKLNGPKLNLPKRNRRKTAVVVRYGGFGDMAIASPIFRILKQQGYYVIANCKPETKCIWDHNPYIDDWIVQRKDAIPPDQLGEYFAEMKKEHDLVINLCESIERSLLFEERDEELFNLPHEERERRCGSVNYSDRTMEIAGLPDRGCRPEIYLSETEEVLGKVFRSKHEDYFLVQWQLAGSSWHKIYPFADEVMEQLLEELPKIKFFLTGPDHIQILNWDHPRVCSRIRLWGPRQSHIMTRFMDLVISPETGVLNAAGSFATPKIGLLTHSNRENLTKYFLNDYSIQSEAPCSPCHRLVETLEKCPLDEKFRLPICMSRFMPKDKIIERVRFLYRKWDSR